MRRWVFLCAVLLAATACQRAPISRSASTFVPAQTLHFQDAAGVDFGTLTQGTDGSSRLSWHVAPQAVELTVYLLPTGQLSASLGAPPIGRPGISVGVASELSFGFVEANGRCETVRGRHLPFRADLATMRRLLARLYHLVVPWTPTVSIDNAIPDQDRQFIDKDGRTFAVLGLSAAAEPSLGLLDARGRLRVWAALAEKQWLSVNLLDRRGDVHLALRFGPQPMPHATVWDYADPDSPDRLAPYALDPAARLEVASDSGGWLPWFQHDLFKATLPIRLIDQRGRVVWTER
ncbi:MAG TPA: hypothetical protein VNE16_01800 [Vicinamibacterales bacterium]|nr:hypothetical protein [Vicinamibacterales bacterium]